MQIVSVLDKPIVAASNARQTAAKARLYAPIPLIAWILFCVFCNCAGWILSAFHQLSPIGYATAFVLSASLMLVFRNRIFPPPCRGIKIIRLARRFRRPFPLSFLVLAALALLGGLLYAPNNYDALAYRIPRVLHWLAEGRWHWVHTEFQRLNTRAPAFEWLSAPWVALLRTDRFLFLINIISFLLLPGLVFSVFRRLGVGAQVAWHWMWLLPAGYCFLLQAGSIGNDLIGVVFALAALDFALRAREEDRARNVWLSVLAAALMTGSKASNLPLLLPWLIAIAPALKLLRFKVATTVAIMCVAALASLVPQMIMNTIHSGDWAGMRAENGQQFMGGKPALRVANNCVLLTIQNFAPPVFPLAKAWNKEMRRVMPSVWQAKLEPLFEPAGAHWELNEMESEEFAGLGFGISALLLASLAAGRKVGRVSPSVSRPGLPRTPSALGQTRPASAAGSWEKGQERSGRMGSAVVWAAAVALMVFLAKSGLSGVARLIAPYYALCIPVLLRGEAQRCVVRAIWWKRFGIAVFALAAVPVILSASRPLWPANSVLAHAGSGKLLARAKTVYSVYALRADGFAPVRKSLPPGLRVLGLVSYDDPETSLWRPFGSPLRIEHVTHNDSAEALRARDIEYVLVHTAALQMLFYQTSEQWVQKMHGEIQSRLALTLRAGTGPTDWLLVRLPPVTAK